MWKTVLAGTTALVIAGGSLAIAQPGSRTDAPRGPSVESINARVDARIARIKDRLRLTAEQEKQWPAVEAAIRELAKQRAARMGERRTSRDGADLIERTRRGSEAMTARAAALKQFADAIEPFYKSLDDRQKRQFATLLRNARGAAWHGGRDGGRRFSEGPRARGDHRFDDRGRRGYRGSGRDGR